MADIDELLKGSFERLAEPADSAGVADAIRSRVAGGDAGVSVAGSTAPGWAPPRPRWLWPMVGTVIGLAAIVAVLVAVLVWPASPQPVVSPVVTPSSAVTPSPTPAVTPTPTPTPTVDVQPPPPPPPARDTTAPAISAGQWSDGGVVYNTGSNWPTCNESADIVVSASDDQQLATVSAATSMAGTRADLIGSGGGTYTFRFSGSGAQSDTKVTVTFTATDAAGNSAGASRQVTLRPCIVIG